MDEPRVPEADSAADELDDEASTQGDGRSDAGEAVTTDVVTAPGASAVEVESAVDVEPTPQSTAVDEGTAEEQPDEDEAEEPEEVEGEKEEADEVEAGEEEPEEAEAVAVLDEAEADEADADTAEEVAAADADEFFDVPEEADWYVVHTYSGYENKVKRNLEHRIESMGMLDRIFHVVVPVEEEVDIKDGQRRIVERKIFPGYVLVCLILDDESWSVVRNTPGVTGFVGTGGQGVERLKPTPLRPDEVEKILRRMDAEEPTIRVSFRSGQNVRIVDGPFTDFHGIVDTIDMERGKVRLMVNFFGRETPVELDFLQVEKV